MLEYDWLTNVQMCAIIFREMHGERISRQLLNALHIHITSPSDLSYFKVAYSLKQQKNQNSQQHCVLNCVLMQVIIFFSLKRSNYLMPLTQGRGLESATPLITANSVSFFLTRSAFIQSQNVFTSTSNRRHLSPCPKWNASCALTVLQTLLFWPPRAMAAACACQLSPRDRSMSHSSF